MRLQGPKIQEEAHENARLEAFCDAVFAIAMTLLIVDVKLPDISDIRDTAGLWRALGQLGPSAFAFLLSFGIILITWVNHHNTLKLVGKSTPSFNYANGFLLLTVVIIPFPTAMLGAFILTDHAAPAVVLYNAVLTVQAIGWLFVNGTALTNHLCNGERAAATIREHRRSSFQALLLYALLALAAFWFPVAVAAVTTATWIFWLTLSIRAKV